VEKLITKSFKRLLDKGLHRGFITYEELGKSLGKRHFSQENVEQAAFHIFDNKICLVEKKSDYRVNKKKDTSNQSEKSKEGEKSDDPIRMYLREMGGVELLSREGEIAIAKRIEAGKDVMTNGLFQSPITAKKVFEWKEKLEKEELLVREIIDIDSSYIESEDADPILKKQKQKEKTKGDLSTKTLSDKKEKTNNESEQTKEEEYSSDEDEFNPSLAAMEQEVKPKVIATIDEICKNYNKLIKIQNEKLECALSVNEF